MGRVKGGVGAPQGTAASFKYKPKTPIFPAPNRGRLKRPNSRTPPRARDPKGDVSVGRKPISIDIITHLQLAVRHQRAEPCVICGDCDVAEGDIFCVHCWDSCPRFNEVFRCEIKARLAWGGYCLQLFGAIRPFPCDRPTRTKPSSSKASNLFDRLQQQHLAEFAGRYTDLNPNGPGRWKGLCPIHQEKTPSLYIYVEP